MNPPTYDEISARAQSLWREWGCPDGRDTEIWLEAEQQLRHRAPSRDASQPLSSAEEAKAEPAVEFHSSPARSPGEASRAAGPKQNPRAPKANPVQFGKTLSKKLRPPQG